MTLYVTKVETTTLQRLQAWTHRHVILRSLRLNVTESSRMVVHQRQAVFLVEFGLDLEILGIDLADLRVLL